MQYQYNEHSHVLLESTTTNIWPMAFSVYTANTQIQSLCTPAQPPEGIILYSETLLCTPPMSETIFLPNHNIKDIKNKKIITAASSNSLYSTSPK